MKNIDFKIKSSALTPKGIAKAINDKVMFCEKDFSFTVEMVENMVASGELVADGRYITCYVL